MEWSIVEKARYSFKPEKKRKRKLGIA